MLPLMRPVIASYAIFQFLWAGMPAVGLTFSGGSRTVQPLTAALAAMTETGVRTGPATAGAFVSIIRPRSFFFALQRFFVLGLLAGSVRV